MNDNTGECVCGHRGYEHGSDRQECCVEDCECTVFQIAHSPTDNPCSDRHSLHDVNAACTVTSNHVGIDLATAIAEFEARCEAMRRMRATRWADIELAPLPAQPADPREDEETQRSDRLAVAKAEREQRLRFGATGGPRPVGNPR